MIEEHQDPISETHQQSQQVLRILVTAAAQLVDQRARRRRAEAEDLARRARAASEAAGATLVATLSRDEWWARATPESAARAAYEARALGASRDGTAALNAVADGVRQRWGVSVWEPLVAAESPQAAGAQLGDTLTRYEAARELWEPALDPAWWETAQPEEASRAWAAAAAWADHAPAADARAAIEAGTQGRWGAQLSQADGAPPDRTGTQPLSSEAQPEVLGAETAATVMAAPGWQSLQKVLTDPERAPDGPQAALRRVAAQRPLTGARDPAAVLRVRLTGRDGARHVLADQRHRNITRAQSQDHGLDR